jgi:hypothetical protein
MKAALPLLLLFGSWSSFADDVRIDPAYIDNGVYTQEVDEYALSEAIYNGAMDDPIVIPVLEGAGTAPCTRNTPVGVACYCNHGVRAGRPFPGWQVDPNSPLHYVRPGWRVSVVKGMHAAGRLCYRDRMPTPEERAQFRRTGH